MDSATAAAWWNVWVNLAMALATIGAAVYAIRAYRSQRERDLADQEARDREAEHERAELARRVEAMEQERRDRVEAERRAQAEMVCVWPSYTETKLSSAGTPRPRPVVAYVVNGSHLPITGIEVTFHRQNKDGLVVESAHRAAIGPGETIEVDLSDNWGFDPNHLAGFNVAVIFRDAGRRLWRREHTGELILYEDAPPIETKPTPR